MVVDFSFNPINLGLFGPEPALEGVFSTPSPCCNSFVFKVIMPKFYTLVGCVKCYQENNNESFCFNNDVMITSLHKFVLFVRPIYESFLFSSNEAQNW